MIIRSAEFLKSGTDPTHYPNDLLPEFVFLGRSNVGKSTFINTILNRKNIARTSAKPGKTQTLNFYNVNNECLFVDVPGYGYAVASKEQKIAFGKMIETYLLSRQTLRCAFLLVDLRHDPSTDDCLMYQFLKHYNVKVVIVATKADKIGKTLISKHVKAIKVKLKMASDDVFIPYSSETKLGVDLVHQQLEIEIYQNS